MGTIKLIATDLDGTLLDEKGHISKRNAEAVKMAIAKGITVCIASGRIHATCLPFQEELGLDTPLIAVNGAWIQHGERVLGRSPLAHDAFVDALSLSERHSVAALAVIDDRMAYLSEHREYMAELLGFYEADRHFFELPSRLELIERVKAQGCERLAFFSREIEALAPIRAELAQNFSQRLEISSSWATNIEAGALGINKGTAVAKIAAMYGFSPEEVMTLGDHDNDAAMLRFAGCSVAMGNASEIAKDAAMHVTKTNAEDGFALAIEKYAL